MRRFLVSLYSLVSCIHRNHDSGVSAKCSFCLRKRAKLSEDVQLLWHCFEDNAFKMKKAGGVDEMGKNPLEQQMAANKEDLEKEQQDLRHAREKMGKEESAGPAAQANNVS